MSESIDIEKTCRIHWMYPEIYGPLFSNKPRDVLKIGLMHVPAADDIEIEYDSERDGWAIYREAFVTYELIDGVYQERTERREKAFIPAWEDDHKTFEEWLIVDDSGSKIDTP